MRRFFPTLLIACIAALSVRGADAPRTPPLTGRMKQVHDRVEALFRSRSPDAERPASDQNPFRDRDSMAASAPEASAVPAGVSEATLLHEAIASLSISSGTMARGDGPISVIVNQTFKRTGDYVLTRIRENVVMQLRIANITEVGVTFEWQGSRETMSFARPSSPAP